MLPGVMQIHNPPKVMLIYNPLKVMLIHNLPKVMLIHNPLKVMLIYNLPKVMQIYNPLKVMLIHNLPKVMLIYNPLPTWTKPSRQSLLSLQRTKTISFRSQHPPTSSSKHFPSSTPQCDITPAHCAHCASRCRRYAPTCRPPCST